MRCSRLVASALVALVVVPAASAARSKPRAKAAPESPAAAAPALDIPFSKFVLGNGLTLIVHEDHDAPIAAVNVWYHVGSGNERPGRTGFAHLFEHLMFQGSENHPGEWFEPFERIGATEQNGTTNVDRTNYFQNVPVSALDMTLWLESDRMGHLLGAIDQAKLDEQRGVVQNEKRQGENQPYGKVWSLLAEATYPPGHPYSWSTIGSMEDLNAASLDDVKEWFRTYYGPNNAVLVVAGDVKAEEVRAKVETYFGHIPPGPPLQRPSRWIAKRTGTRRHVMQDRVPQARIYRTWNTPAWGDADADYLELAGDVLSSGKGSRLWKRLVYDEQIATDVAAYASASKIAGQFAIQVTAKPGADLARVEALVAEELQRFLDEGPEPEELTRVQAADRASFVRNLERVGGFGGKSNRLAMAEVYGGSPDAWKPGWERSQAATPEQVRDAARRWLADGDFVLTVVPFPEAKAGKAGADRTRMPEPGELPVPSFPRFERAELPNGLTIALAENHSLPRVEMQLVLDIGTAADQHASPGTAGLVLDMLDEGTTTRDAIALSEDLDLLGASLSTGSTLDVSTVSLSTLASGLPGALEILADVVVNPSFPDDQLSRLRSQRLAGIAREKADPSSAGLRVLPRLMFGEGHAYGNPLSGTGTEAAVKALTRDDLVAFHRAWFRPNAATLLVVGDVTMEALRPQVEKLFAGWERGDVPGKNLADVPPPTKAAIYLIDRPGAVQSTILVGHPGPPKSAPDDLALEAMNRVLGGTFTSRINMNLREDKSWSYGARSSMAGSRGPRPFYVSAPVQSDKTKESCVEIRKELEAILASRPVTEDELRKAKDLATLPLPGRWETMNAVLSSKAELVRFGLPDDYWDRYPDAVRALTVDDLRTAAVAHVHPGHAIWLVVGDRAKIEGPLKDLGWGDVTVLDADGRPAAATSAAP